MGGDLLMIITEQNGARVLTALSTSLKQVLKQLLMLLQATMQK